MAKLKMLRVIVVAFIPLLLFATVTPTLGSVKSHTVQIEGVVSVKVNKGATEAFRFNPGTIFVRSGDMLVFTNTFCDPRATCAISSSGDGHTISVVSADFLKSIDSNTTILFFCAFDPTSTCGQILGAHGVSGASPTVLVDTTGQPSIFQMNGQAGNSIYIFSRLDPRGPSTIEVTVNGSPGAYHYFCAIHPWMQGKIVITSNADSSQ